MLPRNSRFNGFSLRERIRYLMRESVATTLTGLGIGVLAAALITETLVRIIEAPDTMCDRSINGFSLMIAVAVESLFALLINLLASAQ